MGLSETSFRLRSEKAGQNLLTNQLVVQMFAHLQKSDAHSCLSICQETVRHANAYSIVFFMSTGVGPSIMALMLAWLNGLGSMLPRY